MSKIKKADLLQLIQEQADMMVELSSMVKMNKLSIIKLENEREQPKLKQLDQSVFDGLDKKWRFAAVDKNSKAWRYSEKPHVDDGYAIWMSDSTVPMKIGEGYDASNWKGSLIERSDIAKELLEVDLSSELTGSDLARAMLARGDYHVMCAVSDISESDAILSCNSAVITSGEIRGAFTNSFDGLHEHAVPINNQGEPLTASEVGL